MQNIRMMTKRISILSFELALVKPKRSHKQKIASSMIQVTSLSAVDSMTSLLMSKANSKNVVDIPLITKSAENVGSCLNNMLNVGAFIASGSSNSGQVSDNHLFPDIGSPHP